MDATNQKQSLQKVRPHKNANFFSKLFFIYLIPLFYKGYNNVLSEDDLLPSDRNNDATLLTNKLEKEWHNQKKKRNQKASLWIALGKVFGPSLVISGVWYMVIELLIRLAQPLLLSELLKYYEPSNTTVTKEQAYLYSSLIVLSAAISMIFQHQFMLYQFTMGVRIRVSASGLVYRKALSLSRSSLTETNVGKMVNLISNDVSRFESGIKHIHNLWLAPLEVVVILVLLYVYVGPTGMTGVFFLMLFMPFQMWLGKKTSIFRLKTALKTDERIRFMNEIISGIQVIKMYTWEKSFAKLVAISRSKEMQQIRKTSVIRAIIMSFQLFINQIAIFLCVLVFVLTGNSVNAQYVYVLTSFYNIFRVVITKRFPEGATQIAETSISVRRLKEFLMREEIKVKDEPKVNDKLILFENASVKWCNKMNECSLSNINLDVSKQELIAVIGAVGSGKSTFINAILGELPPQAGAIQINGKLSYAAQEPFLFLGSVRQNIVFDEKFDHKKYEEIVRVCALKKDFDLFPHGDKTLVGERGVSLSGGQKARINLARAVYRDADIYLLDDPLSAVDTHVGRHIFEECIEGYLHSKCVVLVTHQLQYLNNVKKVLLMENGRVDFMGSFEKLQETDNEFVQLFKKRVVEEEEDNFKNGDKKKSAKAVIENMDNKNSKGSPTIVQESRATGSISNGLYKVYMNFGGNCCVVFFLASIFLLAQLLSSATDYYLSWWVNAEAIRTSKYNIKANNFNQTGLIVPTINNQTDFIRSADQPSWIENFWLQYMTDKVALTMYTTIFILLLIVAVNRSIWFFHFCVKASIKMHNIMFNNIVYASMIFFNTNPSGRILNRFSRDMNQVDETLPVTMIDTVQNGLTVLFAILIVATVNPWMLIPTGVMLVIFYLLRKVYMATSRDIKRIESAARSPVYSHLSTSLQGLTTIRAFGAQKVFLEEFDQHQNQNSAAFITFIAIGRCFGLWLDMHCVAYIFLVTTSFLFFKTDSLGGFVGLSITQALTLTGQFQWCMRQWTELENAMTCVERIKEYIDIEPENDSDAKEPPKNWPEQGNIIFKDLSMKYSTEGSLVLKNLTFTIESQEKVGIVGRTGAGKSSIIIALFRLAENDGLIAIDNVDINEVSLRKLRSSVSIIPQEPVLFTGTLRKNLDPFDEYSDESLWKALEEVELKETVKDLPHGLESTMSEGGSNFSVGQRQLVCLARAIVRNNKILVLDEATANVDPQTDALIQSTIRSKFAGCTVLTIAHRLHTIMDSDKVLVMDAGRVVEFGSPFELLQNERGVFTGMVEETGRATAANLVSIAEIANYQNGGSTTNEA